MRVVYTTAMKRARYTYPSGRSAPIHKLEGLRTYACFTPDQWTCSAQSALLFTPLPRPTLTLSEVQTKNCRTPIPFQVRNAYMSCAQKWNPGYVFSICFFFLGGFYFKRAGLTMECWPILPSLKHGSSQDPEMEDLVPVTRSAFQELPCYKNGKPPLVVLQSCQQTRGRKETNSIGNGPYQLLRPIQAAFD